MSAARLFAVMTATALLAQPLSAQCDRVKKLDGDRFEDGYRPVTRTYCQGIFGEDVSGRITFIGMTVRPSRIRTTDRVSLTWSPPDVPLHIRAQSIRLRREDQAFRMDAHVAGGSYDWNMSAVARQTIPASALHLMAWAEPGREPPPDPDAPADTADARLYEPAPVIEDVLFVPLQALQGRDPIPARGYRLTFLPSHPVGQVRYAVHRVESPGERPPELVYTPLQGEFPGLEPLDVSLDIQSDLSGPGTYFFDIEARQNGAEIHMTLWFHHAG